MKNNQIFEPHFFFKTFRDNKWRVLLFSIIVSGYILMMTAFYPSIKDKGADFDKLLNAYPAALKEAFNMGTNTFSQIEGFISVEYFSFVWLIIMAFVIFSLGASAIAGEINDQTANFTFTLPRKRWKIVLAKFLASYLIILFITLVTLISTIIGIYLVNEQPNIGGFIVFFFVGAAVDFFMLGLTLFISSMCDSRGKVYGIASVIFIVSYLIHVLAGISDAVSKFYFLSFLKYYGNAQKILTEANFKISYLLILFIAGLIFTAAGLLVAEKRDL
jgi:ABC-2 type transport system permease protein